MPCTSCFSSLSGNSFSILESDISPYSQAETCGEALCIKMLPQHRRDLWSGVTSLINCCSCGLFYIGEKARSHNRSSFSNYVLALSVQEVPHLWSESHKDLENFSAVKVEAKKSGRHIFEKLTSSYILPHRSDVRYARTRMHSILPISVYFCIPILIVSISSFPEPSIARKSIIISRFPHTSL